MSKFDSQIDMSKNHVQKSLRGNQEMTVIAKRQPIIIQGNFPLLEFAKNFHLFIAVQLSNVS